MASQPTPPQDPAAHRDRGGLDSNVAVIAIHGVGNHLSGASAKCVSDLLIGIGRIWKQPEARDQQPPYAGFLSRDLEVPLRPAGPTKPIAGETKIETKKEMAARFASRVKSSAQTSWHAFDERRGYLAQRVESARSVTQVEPDRGEFGYEFMHTQLADYEGEKEGRSFSTIRLERQREKNSPAVNLHIYDAHYADLKKPTKSIPSFFLTFYQLLIHLGSLSLLAVYWAQAENAGPTPEGRRWSRTAALHATSIRMLILFVPLLNLVLLALGLSALVPKLSDGAALTPALILASLMGAGATLFAAQRWRPPRRPVVWAGILVVGAAVVLGLFSLVSWLLQKYFYLSLPFSDVLLLLTWLAFAGLGVMVIAWLFDSVRPGAFWLAAILYTLNAVLLLFLVGGALKISQGGIALGVLWTMQSIFGELSVCWIVCLASAAASTILGERCIRALPPGGSRAARARAALRTGRLAFALPASLFLVVTMALWSGILIYSTRKLQVFDKAPPSTLPIPGGFGKVVGIFVPELGNVEKWMSAIEVSQSKNSHPAASPVPGAVQPWNQYLRGILLISVTAALPATLGLMGAAFALILWMVLPSVVQEIRARTLGTANAPSRWLGEWLSRGLDSTAILTRLLWSAIVPLPLVFGLLDSLAWHQWVGPSTKIYEFAVFVSAIALRMVDRTGVVLAVSGVAVFGLGLKYLGTVLDTLLDVDNYLRTSPKESTPRARIAERYASLLRFIGTYRDEHGRPYDRLVIVAHSLGSMVTTDLLRYLKRSCSQTPDPALEPFGFGPPRTSVRIPIYLFTMGCPLRQLLNRFFPHLYWWVSDLPDNTVNTLGPASDPPLLPICGGELPDPGDMCVEGWLNAYRSGDYVGRWLWVGHWLQRNNSATGGGHPQPVEASTDPAPRSRAEMCIGLGAHTHYWDRTAPEVANKLDVLISQPAQMFP